jgi:hypothetical protein
MKAVCVRECTIPGRGLVEVGVKVDVADESAPWLKHFKVIRAETPEPAKEPSQDAPAAAAPAPKAETPEPAKRGRGGRRKG